jgi:hypothetical protein
MLFIKNFSLHTFDFSSGTESVLVHDYIDKVFVMVYGWFALSDDNMLYQVTSSSNNNMQVNQIYDKYISNAKITHGHFFYDHKISSKLSVINSCGKIIDLHNLLFNDLNKLKHFSTETLRYDDLKQINILITTYIVNDNLMVEVTFPQLEREPKIMCVKNIVYFTYDADNLYVVNNSNNVLITNKTNIICADTLVLNFNNYCCLESNYGLFAWYQGERIQTNFISKYDYPIICIVSSNIINKCELIVTTYYANKVNIYGCKFDTNGINPQIIFRSITDCRYSYFNGTNLAVENNNGGIDIYIRDTNHNFVAVQTVEGVLGYEKNVTKSANNITQMR